MDGSGHHSNPVGPLEKLLELCGSREFPTSVVHSTPQPKDVLPPRAKRLSSETKFELIRRYIAGESAQALSKDLGIHRTTALSVLEVAGVKRRYRVMTDTRIRRAIALYDSGRSLVNIGSILKVNPQTVRNSISKHGVRIRGSHDWRAMSLPRAPVSSNPTIKTKPDRTETPR